MIGPLDLYAEIDKIYTLKEKLENKLRETPFWKIRRLYNIFYSLIFLKAFLIKGNNLCKHLEENVVPRYTYVHDATVWLKMAKRIVKATPTLVL